MKHQASKLDLIMKELIGSDEPKKVGLQRGLWLKYEPETEDTPFSLKAIRKGIYPPDGKRAALNYPSLTEQNIVLNSLFWAAEEMGREIGEVPLELEKEVVEGEKSGLWYAVGWEWREFKRVALLETGEGKSGNNYQEWDKRRS